MSASTKNLSTPLLVLLAGLFVVFATTACSADDPGGNHSQDSCQPGEIQTCTCDDGSPGERQCMDDETFTSCQCPDDTNNQNQDAGHPDADNQDDTNACGGEGELTYDGALAEPGDSCGPCSDGLLECDGEEALTCEGAGELNSCGGCALLPVEPGEDCEDGTTWECDGTDGIYCRPCEEDEKLVSLAGEEQCLPICDHDDHCDADEFCHEEHDVCIPDEGELDENLCGGFEPLDEEPDTPCAQDRGMWQCDGDDDVICACDSDEEFYDSASDRCVLTDSALCKAYCEIIYGCLTECGYPSEDTEQIVDGCLDGFDSLDPGCNGLIAGDRDHYEEFVYTDFGDLDSDELKDEPNTCADTKWLRCGTFGIWNECTPACEAPANVGDICTDTAQCDSGDLLWGECFGEYDTDGELLGDGICTAGSCYVPDNIPHGSINVDGGCGDGNGCLAYEQQPGDFLAFCVDTCESNDDCDTGSACQLVGYLYDTDSSTTSPQPVGAARMCSQACDADGDCGADSRCNDDGICEFSCDQPGGDTFCADIGGTCVDDDGTEYCELD